MYSLSDYHYELPEQLVAQEPSPLRDQSRLLWLERGTGARTHRRFADLETILAAGDVLVLNNTRVVPGRLSGRKQSGGKAEVLILDYASGVPDKTFNCLVKSSKRPKPGQRLLFERGLEAVCLSTGDETCLLHFSPPGHFERLLQEIGHVPLPPYIRRCDLPADRNSYQTVYASNDGAIAAPTAGLHFTEALLERLRTRGVRIVYLTLHVGYGTFVPVRVEDIRDHRMHAEWFSLPADTAEALNAARQEGRRVVAVGTTCVRTLESCAGADGRICAQNGVCDLFIYPGYRFKVVDGLVTNFHLPRSTLLMLVSAFAGREAILAAYAEAVRLRYRFFSYGDAMLLL